MNRDSSNITIRRATLADIPQIVEVDRRAWWDEVAFTDGQVRSQIETYPEGVFVAEVLAGDGAPMIVGTTCGLRASSVFLDGIHTQSVGT